MKIQVLIRQFGLVSAMAAAVMLVASVSTAQAQSLNPFGNPFAPIVNPTMANRIEIGAVSADKENADTETDFALRVTRKVGKMSAV
mgnify:FL=1